MKLFILVDDPTAYGGIQQFSRNLAAMLQEQLQVVLLVYSGALAQRKSCSGEIVRLNESERRTGWSRRWRGGPETYLQTGWRRVAALLLDIPDIRRSLLRQMTGGDILLINSVHSASCFVPEQVLRNNRVIFVQHTAPEQMRLWRYDFGGWSRRSKVAMFNRYADALVMLSPCEKEHFERYLKLEGKLTPFIRHETPLPPEEEAPAVKTKTVMFLGRLTAAKRVDRILEVARAAGDFQFNLYGDGPEEAKLKLAARDLANVRFHGYAANPRQALDHNAIAIFTSDFEGYPISGIECVAHGKPLLGLNRFPAARDLVEHGRNGLLLDEFQPEEFAAALRRLHADYDFFRDHALRLRAKYDPETVSRQWRDFIAQIMTREISGK